eukprot:12011303-Heterocapsa_arctica.AAC.1
MSAWSLAEVSDSVLIRSCASSLSWTAFARRLSALAMAARRPSSWTPAGLAAWSWRVTSSIC